jgi:hypothetical protein
MRLGRVACIPCSVDYLAKFRHGIVRGDGLVDCPALSPGLDQIQADALQATVFELQDLGCAIGEVDNTARYDRAAVVLH